MCQIDGTLKFSDNMDDWPRVEDGIGFYVKNVDPKISFVSDKEPSGKVARSWKYVPTSARELYLCNKVPDYHMKCKYKTGWFFSCPDPPAPRYI